MAAAHDDDDEDQVQDMVNMHMATRNVWLVKVPTRLHEHWMTKGPNQIIGELEVRGRGDITVKLPQDDQSATSSSAMGDYSLTKNDMTPAERRSKGSMAVFSEGKDHMGFAIEGTVHIRADIRPKSMRNVYGRKLAPKREIIMMDAREGTKATALPMNKQSRIHEQKMREESIYNKKERMDKDKLKLKIFGLFGTHEFINTSDLVAQTQQPRAFLKDTLTEICTQVTQGRLRHHWRLKDEYRS